MSRRTLGDCLLAAGFAVLALALGCSRGRTEFVDIRQESERVGALEWAATPNWATLEPEIREPAAPPVPVAEPAVADPIAAAGAVREEPIRLPPTVAPELVKFLEQERLERERVQRERLEGQVAEYVSRANQLYKEEELSTAAMLLEQALVLEPSSRPALKLQGRVRQAQRKAEGQAQRALVAQYQAEGRRLLDAGDVGRALAYFQAAQALEPASRTTVKLIQRAYEAQDDLMAQRGPHVSDERLRQAAVAQSDALLGLRGNTILTDAAEPAPRRAEPTRSSPEPIEVAADEASAHLSDAVQTEGAAPQWAWTPGEPASAAVAPHDGRNALEAVLPARQHGALSPSGPPGAGASASTQPSPGTAFVPAGGESTLTLLSGEGASGTVTEAPPIPRAPATYQRTYVRGAGLTNGGASQPVLQALASGIGPARGVDGYTIQPGDVLQITVYEEPDLTTKARVSGSGEIIVPLLGRVSVAGATVTGVQEHLTRLLGVDYLVNPQVQVFIESYQPRNVFVTGSVNKPGAYSIPTERPTTVMEAIAMAGGFSAEAAINKTRIIRIEQGAERTIQVNANDIIKKGDKAKDVAVYANDIIFVPESFF